MQRPTPDAPRAIAFLNARIIDPASGRDEPGGLVVRDGVIADLGAHLRRKAPDGTEVVDCQGHVLSPGLIDCQVYTGDPGEEHRETLKTASFAAAAGGVTTIVCMPDTKPVIDQVALVDYVQRRARERAIVNVHIMGAVTRGLEGKEMAEIGLLQRAGAVAFTNGKSSIANSRIMRNALLYAKDFGAVIVHHTEDPYLSDGAAMNSGEMATRLGLPSVHKAAEVMMVERDVRLVEITGGRYHAATISCADSLDVIRRAKAKGLPVTCGVSINHLTLNENDIGPYRTFFKLRPPLRAEEDRVAMVRALAAGEVDVIVSSHDPQDTDEKRRPFTEAADGAIGLETLVPAALRLFHADEVGLMALLRALTINPAKLLGLPGGRLEKGAPADLTLIDLNTPWVVDRDVLRARSKNAPLDEQKVQGRVLRTLVAGKTVYQYGVAIRT
jgi:dihydroorotase